MTVRCPTPSLAGVHPLYNLTPHHPIASAAAVFLGPRGRVAALARDRGCSRQRLSRQAHTLAQACDRTPQRLDRLRHQLADTRAHLADARAHLADAQAQLRRAVVLDRDRQAQFAATAQALAVPLPAARTLLTVVLPKGARAPSVAQLGRDAQAASRR